MSELTDVAPSGQDAAVLNSHLHPMASYELSDFPTPNGKEEVWRFTPIERLAHLFEPHGAPETLQWRANYPTGVTIGELSVAEAVQYGFQAPFDIAAANAFNQEVSGTKIQIPAETELVEPIVIDAAGAGGRSFGRVLIRIGRNAKLTLVIRYRGRAHYSEWLNVDVGEGAQLTFVSIHDWDFDAVHVGQQSFQIGKDAQVKTVTASVGGDLIRLTQTATFSGTGAELELFGIYFVDAGQHIEHRLFIDHNQPNTTSNVDYRGVLQGSKAQGVWVGDVLIRKAAENTATYESNKNLLLTKGCRVESVPNLEIETGVIRGAGHASATGHFDAEQLFYLRSRGIPEIEARRLVVYGFFADIIRRIQLPEVEARLFEVLESELETIAPPVNLDAIERL
ncbi:MAG: Fe-S cluster assembly protein SufD [Propionibacteriaceae bacterium]|nr:Fe-S cluster assembly protein SufD [Propionibacteriaceae bacterium]